MKKYISTVLCVLLVLFAVVGCAQQPTPAVTTNSPASTSAPTVSPSPSAAATQSSAPREAKLNIMMSYPQYADQWQTYVNQFTAKMLKEQNIKVTVNLETPSSDQYDSVLQARLTGGDAPDVYTIQCNNLKTYNNAGYVTDLTSQPFVGKLFGDVKNTVTVDGKVLALPIENQAWGILYNKDMFDKCGLKAPDTLDDLTNDCKVLKQNGYTPFELAFQDQWVPQLMTALTLGGLVSGEHSDWLQNMYADKGSYSEVQDIFNAIDLIMKNGTEHPMETGNDAGCADFANGKAAMWLQGTWDASTILKTNSNIKLGVFALPVNNSKDCTLINDSTSTVLVVYPKTKEMDLSTAFVNYVLDDNDSSALFKACGFNPIATCHTYSTSSWADEAMAYVKAGRSYQDLVLPSSVTDQQGKLLQEYYVGSVKKDQIIAQLDDAFKKANAATASATAKK